MCDKLDKKENENMTGTEKAPETETPNAAAPVNVPQAEPDTSSESEAEEKTEGEEKPEEKTETEGKAEDQPEEAPAAAPEVITLGSKPEPEAPREEPSGEKKPFNRKWLGLLAIPVVVGIGAGAYYYMQTADIYKTQFYPNTSIGEMPVGGMTVEQVRSEIEKKADAYTLTFTQRGEETVYTAEDLGVHYVMEDETGADLLQTMMDQQEPYKWILKQDQTFSYPYPELAYDKDAVEKRIDEMEWVNPKEKQEAKDAYISYNKKKHSYKVVPEELGNYVARSVASTAVYGALDSWLDSVEIPDSAFPQPTVCSDDKELNDFVKEVEKYLSAEITYEDGDVKVVVDREVIEDFLDVDLEARTVELVESRVQTYINTALDGAFDTIGRERTFTTSLSGEFTVSGGTYGKVVYTLEELPKLVESIKAGEKVTREPEYRQTERSKENEGIGNTFVDVNLSQQTLLFVKDGEDFMTSKFVSGCVNKGRGTPTGIYKVEIKAREYTMRKYNAFVHYWMNFYSAVGVGFHDASWRGSFGGNIYKSNGSHGCINMPYESAKKLYNNLDYGTPVLVHY